VVGLVVLWWRRATSFQRVAGSYYSTLPPGKWGLPILGEFMEFMFTQKHNHGQFVEARKAKWVTFLSACSDPLVSKFAVNDETFCRIV